jgi:hypothetical protein
MEETRCALQVRNEVIPAKSSFPLSQSSPHTCAVVPLMRRAIQVHAPPPWILART